MAEIVTIKVIYYKELRALINRIKEIGLKNKGIIFGGLVRCDIIGSYYKKEYFKKELNPNNYWDKEYDIVTNKRTIIPNDMDIYFKDEASVNYFISAITTLINTFRGNIRIINNNNKYISIKNNINHKKAYISLRIGTTLSFPGIPLKFNIDILYKNDDSLIEPPFFNLDFLSNIFLMEKINGSNIIRISNCSGTPIDDMTYYDKCKISNTIMTDIINGKTSFVRNFESYYSESINCYRIMRMIEYEWDIINLPFKIIKKEDITISNEICCICQYIIDINEENKIVEMNTYITKSYYLHYNCFMKHLKSENNKKYINRETNSIECRCPMRNPFNFKKCYKLVSYE